MWPRVNDTIGSSNKNILCPPFFLLKKYEPPRPINLPRVTGRAFMSVSLGLHLVRRSSALGWFRTHAANGFLLVKGIQTCWADISTDLQQ